MTAFPTALHDKLAATIKSTVTAMKLHTQQIVTLQSQVASTAALVPGDWETITLESGWSNVSGSVPAQARLLTSTTVQIIGNIQNGTTTDGTVIGTLTAGYFNTVHAHTFTITAVAGANAVPNAVSQGTLQSTSVTQGTISSGNQVPATDHVFSLSGSSFASGSVHMGPTSGNTFSNDVGGITIEAQNVSNGDLNANQSTNINYNGPCITLGTNGTLTIFNVNDNVSQLSFHEAGLPLFTA